eukprot:674402-Pyramimonas_sp.AAC.1
MLEKPEGYQIRWGHSIRNALLSARRRRIPPPPWAGWHVFERLSAARPLLPYRGHPYPRPPL